MGLVSCLFVHASYHIRWTYHTCATPTPLHLRTLIPPPTCCSATPMGVQQTLPWSPISNPQGSDARAAVVAAQDMTSGHPMGGIGGGHLGPTSPPPPKRQRASQGGTTTAAAVAAAQQQAQSQHLQQQQQLQVQQLMAMQLQMASRPPQGGPGAMGSSSSMSGMSSLAAAGMPGPASSRQQLSSVAGALASFQHGSNLHQVGRGDTHRL